MTNDSPTLMPPLLATFHPKPPTEPRLLRSQPNPDFKVPPARNSPNTETTAPPPQSGRLQQHPNWLTFVNLLGFKLLSPHPHLMPLFRELLDEADQL